MDISIKMIFQVGLLDRWIGSSAGSLWRLLTCSRRDLTVPVPWHRPTGSSQLGRRHQGSLLGKYEEKYGEIMRNRKSENFQWLPGISVGWFDEWIHITSPGNGATLPPYRLGWGGPCVRKVPCIPGDLSLVSEKTLEHGDGLRYWWLRSAPLPYCSLFYDCMHCSA